MDQIKMETFPDIIELNVGGKHLGTMLSTLTKYPDTMLTAMFSGRYVVPRDKDGRYFIDCNGSVFVHILDFLRFGSLPNESVSMEVYALAEYFGLRDIMLEQSGQLTQKDKFPDVVQLNVGGKHLATSLCTLTKYPDSKLAAMFSGSQTVPRDKDGRYFIDCNGSVFVHILDFLRFGSLPNESVSMEVYALAEYFGLRDIMLEQSGQLTQKDKFPDVVQLNVGGKHLATSLCTLTKYPDSKLAAMFSGSQTVPRDKDGRYFIDCNGNVFEYILDFLRLGSLPDYKVSREVYALAENLGLRGIMQERLREQELSRDGLIDLNVRGTNITTTKATLSTTVSGSNWPSKLGSIFTRRPDLKRDDSGRYYIDCDPSMFQQALDKQNPTDVFQEIQSWER